VELVKTLQLRAAMFGHSHCTKRAAKICSGLIAAVLLLQFYWVRELLFMEVVLALGFILVALIGALYGLGYVAVVGLRKVGCGLKAFGVLVSVRQRQRFAKTTVRGFADAKQEIS